MTPQQIKDNAPDGATHYRKMFRTIFYMKVVDHYLYYWQIESDLEYKWTVVGCRSIMKNYINSKLKPL